MADLEFSDRVQRWNRLSKPIALIAALAVFIGGDQLVASQGISMITAAVVGIGVRWFVVYWASMTIPVEERVSIEAHPSAGEFHHGAVAAGLIVGSFIMVGTMSMTVNTNLSLLVGILSMVVFSFVFWQVLPR